MVKMTTEAIEAAKDKNKEEEEILEQAQDVAGRMERLRNEIRAAWLDEKTIRDHESIAKVYAKRFNLNLTDAKKQLFTYPEKYEIQGNDIPKVIKEMRNFRRTLKGQKKLTFTKSIDNLIDAYSDYLDKCVDSIYWIQKYKAPLKQMNNSDKTLSGVKAEKLNPLKHSFADGCYIREVFNPKEEIIVTKIHKVSHPFFLIYYPPNHSVILNYRKLL